MSSGSTGSTGSGFGSGLVVLCGLLLVAGFLLPSGAEESERPGFRPMSAAAAPVRLVVPALKIRAPITPIEVNAEQVLDPPRNARDIGWWRRSARPGADAGQTVLTGHTVHTGGGVLDDLGALRPGQRIKVVTRVGTMVYRTTKVVTWTKAELAARAEQLFGQERDRERLVLVTCSGWDGREYDSNVVAFAVPLGVRAPRA